MRTQFLLVATLLAFGLGGISPHKAYAQDVTAEQEAIIKEQAEAEKQSKELANQLNTDMRAIVEDMDKADQKHFYLIYNNHNIIATVKTVRDDVGKAVEACGENNADMKDEMTARYTLWKKAVNNKLDEASAYIQNMIVAQDYAENADIKDLLQVADDLRAATAKKIQKVPVTSKEACTFLLKKMDETQNTMIALLDKTLISGPMLMESTAVDAADPEEEAVEQDTAVEEPAENTTDEAESDTETENEEEQSAE